jgi:transcriptional regulator with XRE-family HTH domain
MVDEILDLISKESSQSLAEICGVSIATVQAWKTKKVSPNKIQFCRLLQAAIVKQRIKAMEEKIEALEEIRILLCLGIFNGEFVGSHLDKAKEDVRLIKEANESKNFEKINSIYNKIFE